ncbi:DLIC-domain-containing protein [Martensiomyces pterosporus]|nr:DLIC-domain-containing protein [Martensiomyces pterosporus]
MDSHLKPDEGAAEEKINLWESVLKEVGSSKAVATKNVLVLGDSNSGKTGVVSQLFQASLHPQLGNGQDAAASASVSTGIGGLNEPSTEIDALVTLSKHDLALSYSYMDVRDEDNEEIVARLGIYQLASDRTTDRDLLRLVLDARTFPSSAAVIVLDWSKPWRFIKSLLRWHNVLNEAVELVCKDTGGREATSAKGAGGWTLGKATVDECRERLERFLQEYSEATETSAGDGPASAPTGAGSTAAGGAGGTLGGASGAGNVDVAAKTANVLLPLGKGVLEANLGIPLIVVCTKSDAMDLVERERGFKEEDFDYIQQVLRAICLRFGAALIYTTTHNPTTFSTLYHYLVHRLLSGPSTLPSLSADAGDAAGDLDEDGAQDAAVAASVDGAGNEAGAQSGSTATAPSSGSQLSTSNYPFRVRANVVDRDVVFVPAGWDSVAKINYLREPFDVHAVQEAWDGDEGRYRAIVERAVRESSISDPARLGSADSKDPAPLNAALQEEPEKATASNSALIMFGEVIAAPKQRSGRDADGSSAVAAVAAAAAGMANHVSVEDDQTFLERLYAEQQDQMAIDGEEAGDSGAQQTDSYLEDSGRGRAGGSSNRFVSNLLRSAQTAESSLSTALDMPPSHNDTQSGHQSDDGADEGDRLDTSSVSPSQPASHQSAFPPAMPSSASHLRGDGEPTSMTLGRLAGSRLGRSTLQPLHPPTGEGTQPGSIRRKLTLPSSGGAGGSGEAAGAASNEDLTSFFQNLLGRKGGATSSVSSSSGKNSPQAQPRQLGGSLSRASNLSQKDVQAELEKWKSQIKRPKE